MHRTLQSTLALFLAIWLPFCCCQVRAAAGAIAHRVSEQPAARAHSCCEGCRQADERESCDERAARDEQVQRGALADSSHGTPAKTNAKGCCVSCKDRVLPAEPSMPGGDTVGADVLAATACLFDVEFAPARPLACAQLGTGPPGAPSGRLILVRAGILLV